MAPMMPMITTTMTSSIKLKPHRLLFNRLEFISTSDE